jgi:hypothetical protein
VRATPRRQAISEAFFGNVLLAHFERHARIDEHVDAAGGAPVTTTMPTMPVQRSSLAVGDVCTALSLSLSHISTHVALTHFAALQIGYLIGRLRCFAKAIADRTEDELLLERSLGTYYYYYYSWIDYCDCFFFVF